MKRAFIAGVALAVGGIPLFNSSVVVLSWTDWMTGAFFFAFTTTVALAARG